MAQYKVRSGQNIYDIAVQLYGSIEGVIDLLASNPDISVNTVLQCGMLLTYHDGFVLRQPIKQWLDDNDVKVANGHHYYEYQDIYAMSEAYLKSIGNSYTERELDSVVKDMATPKMTVIQNGRVSTIRIHVAENGYVMLDWGDSTAITVITPEMGDIELEHAYDGDNEHKIRFYGIMRTESLDLTEVCGEIYPEAPIVVFGDFLSNLDDDDDRAKLFIPDDTYIKI